MLLTPTRCVLPPPPPCPQRHLRQAVQERGAVWARGRQERRRHGERAGGRAGGMPGGGSCGCRCRACRCSLPGWQHGVASPWTSAGAPGRLLTCSHAALLSRASSGLVLYGHRQRTLRWRRRAPSCLAASRSLRGPSGGLVPGGRSTGEAGRQAGLCARPTEAWVPGTRVEDATLS